MIKGVGNDANPIDGDRVTIELSIKDGRIATVGATGIRVGMSMEVGGKATSVWFATGEEARHFADETFAGCETARQASLALTRLAHGATVEEAMAINVRQVIIAMGRYVEREHERCVLTVLGALRSALIDAHVTALAAATVEAKRMRPK